MSEVIPYEDVKKKQIINILQKVADGRILSKAEQKEYEEYEAEVNKKVKNEVTLTTQGKVAQAIGVTVAVLRHWREAYADAPARVDGREPLEHWQEWVNKNKADIPAMKAGTSTLKDLKAEEQTLRNERLRGQIELDRERVKVLRGQYIPRGEVENQIAPLVAEIISLIDERDTEASNWCPGRTTGEIRAKQKETRDIMFEKIRNGITSFCDAAQELGKRNLASEPTSVNSPGAGRPRNPNSERSKARVKKAAKKAITKK